MIEVLWFRRDLRVEDSAILHHANGEVLPIFIFDKNILSTLEHDDQRVVFIYGAVQKLKLKLQRMGLDLAIFYGDPKEILFKLKSELPISKILCSCDYDEYSINRDKKIEKHISLKRYYDSFLFHPKETLKKDGTPYKVFTPFYNNLKPLFLNTRFELLKPNEHLQLTPYDYSKEISFDQMSFSSLFQNVKPFQNERELLFEFDSRVVRYEENRDDINLDANSHLGVHLRFGTLSIRELFNRYNNHEPFIRQLFWREFYAMLLYFYPKSQYENFNELNIPFREDKEDFERWCTGKTGFPIIDAAMRHFNQTGLMHNRLRIGGCFFFNKEPFSSLAVGRAILCKKTT